MNNTTRRVKEPPLTREIKRLHALGKAPDIIALRLGVKISKVLATLTPAASNGH